MGFNLKNRFFLLGDGAPCGDYVNKKSSEGTYLFRGAPAGEAVSKVSQVGGRPDPERSLTTAFLKGNSTISPDFMTGSWPVDGPFSVCHMKVICRKREGLSEESSGRPQRSNLHGPAIAE
jgi:hypothetical protein